MVLLLRNCLLLGNCPYSTVFLQIKIGVVKLRDSGSMGSSKCFMYDNGKSTHGIKCKNHAFKGFAVQKRIPYVFWQLVKWQTNEIVGHYCHLIFIGKQYSSSQMKNNPESGEFCCLHICLFNNGKAIHFRTTLTPLRLLFLSFQFGPV